MEVKLRKKGFKKVFKKPYIHGVRDYRKVLNFQGLGNWIDKVAVCTACRFNSEDLCIGFCSDDHGNCVYQITGPFRTECTRE